MFLLRFCGLKKMQVAFGILMIITEAASGSLFQDPVVCTFTESNQCYVALGQQLHLQIPLVDSFNLKITDRNVTDRIILKYRKAQSNSSTLNIPRWQFVNDNKTLILTSAERSNSGTYTLETYGANGTRKGNYSLQLNIQVQVSSVKVSYSCSSPGVMKMSCSADGDNLHFNWTSDLNKNLQLENGNRTLILVKDPYGKVTCSVENHVSRDHITTELHPCPDVILISLSLVFVLLIMISIFACYMYKKRQGQKNKESHARNEDVEYAEVVPRATKRKQKKKEDEVQYGELVFNTPARNKHKVAKVQDDCVYSHVQHSQ